MVWAILALLGVPIWLCVAGIGVFVVRSRAIHKRPGNLSVRRRLPGKTRWTRGNAVWVQDVFAFRSSPASWNESLTAVREVVTLLPDRTDCKKLRRLGSPPSVLRFAGADGAYVDYAVAPQHAFDLLGSFAADAAANEPVSAGDA